MENSHESLMDRSGMGPLLGVALALGIVLIAMSALLLESWLAVGIAAVAVIVTLAVVTVVIAAIAGDDEEPGRLRDHIPGISPRP